MHAETGKRKGKSLVAKGESENIWLARGSASFASGGVLTIDIKGHCGTCLSQLPGRQPTSLRCVSALSCRSDDVRTRTR